LPNPSARGVDSETPSLPTVATHLRGPRVRCHLPVEIEAHSEVASISRTESKRNPVPWNPSSKTPLPKRAGSSINRSNARSFATGYRAVSLLLSSPRNLVSTKACSTLGGIFCPPPKLGGGRRRGAEGLRLRIFNLNWMLLVAKSATCMSSGTF